MKVRILVFNNRGFPKQSQADINRGDYAVLDVEPDLVLEQERWFTSQWNGFKKIFSVARGYVTHRPKLSAVSGVISAHKASVFTRISHFSFFGHTALPYICNFRTFAGEVLKVNKTKKSLTYINVHPTPSAWGSRFASKPKLQNAARRAWHAYMNRVKNFATNQIHAGRSYVVIGGDFNATEDKLRECFGNEIAGKKVRYFSSASGYKIDHIVVIGNVKAYEANAIDGVPSDHDPFYVDLELL